MIMGSHSYDDESKENSKARIGGPVGSGKTMLIEKIVPY